MSTTTLSFTSADLITDITTVSHIPVGNSTFTNQKLLDIANNELQTSLLRQMVSVREGYFLTYTDITANATGSYDIPGDAIGEKIALVQIVASTALIPVNRVEIGEMSNTQTPPNGGYGFYIQDNAVKVFPYSSLPGSVRIWYYRRPSKIVLTTACAKVVSVSTNAVTVTAIPSGWVASDIVDLQQGLPNFKLYATSISISSIVSLVINIASGGSNLAANDFLVPVNQSCVIQIPVEFRPLLVQRVVCKLYEIQGYLEKLKKARESLKEMEKDVLELIAPRVQEQAKVICVANGGIIRRRSILPAT